MGHVDQWTLTPLTPPNPTLKPKTHGLGRWETSNICFYAFVSTQMDLT